MIDKQPASTAEIETNERPVQYSALEDTLQDLIIGNNQLEPRPEHDAGDRLTALNYRIYPDNPGAGSAIGFNYGVRIPEDREEPTRIAVYDGFNERPEWEWNMGASEISGNGVLGALTPDQAAQMTRLIKTSDYYREQKGLQEVATTKNPFTRWLRSKR